MYTYRCSKFHNRFFLPLGIGRRMIMQKQWWAMHMWTWRIQSFSAPKREPVVIKIISFFTILKTISYLHGQECPHKDQALVFFQSETTSTPKPRIVQTKIDHPNYNCYHPTCHSIHTLSTANYLKWLTAAAWYCQKEILGADMNAGHVVRKIMKNKLHWILFIVLFT